MTYAAAMPDPAERPAQADAAEAAQRYRPEHPHAPLSNTASMARVALARQILTATEATPAPSPEAATPAPCPTLPRAPARLAAAKPAERRSPSPDHAAASARQDLAAAGLPAASLASLSDSDALTLSTRLRRRQAAEITRALA